MSKCSNHPDAPHGFNRSASHAEGRYVCDCEGWIPDDEENKMTTIDKVMATIDKARLAMQQDGKTIAELKKENDQLIIEVGNANEDADRYLGDVHELEAVIDTIKRAATVLLDTIKRGDDPTAAMYQLEQLL